MECAGMVFLLISLAVFFAGGCAALASGRGPTASRIGAGSAMAASVAGLVPTANCLLQSASSGRISSTVITVGKLPMGELSLCLDLLSAIFLVPILLLTALAALYAMDAGGGCRLRPAANGAGGEPYSDADGAGIHTGTHWFFYNLLAGGMVLTATANDAFLFLLAWEVMSLTPFFLITMGDGSAATRAAGWTYLVAAHLGALFLLAFFALLSAKHGDSLSFATFAKGAFIDPGLRGGSGLLFLLALIGFGAKAGFMPLHVWLPEAYPASPSHVAALMSGAATKMGIYGLVRALTFLGAGETWWALTLTTVGAVGAFAGIVYALAQPDIKRSLAFSSVENIGIICMALGLGLLCLQNGHTGAAALAAAGALVHLVNHSFSKALLFLCAGCVLHGVGSVRLRLLGGLQKRMPVVGWCFVLGGAAISALPPLNGFAGEFFIYLSMVFGGTAFVQDLAPEYSLVLWGCLFILAATGGFTLLCFTRLYGVAFLGAPRSEAASDAQGPAVNELAAIAALALLCVVSAVAAPRVASLCATALSPMLYAQESAAPSISAAPPAEQTRPAAYMPESLKAPRLFSSPRDPASAIALLRQINTVFLLFVLAFAGAFLFRRRLMRGRQIGASPTWDCGYIAPTARMQYTGGSFSQPTTWFMRTLLKHTEEKPQFTEYFPLKAKATLTCPDWIKDKYFAPLFSFVERLAGVCKKLQHGQANGYILYILITLVALLAWELQ